MTRIHLILLGLALFAAPHMAAAAVIVAEPTGDAEPALLAELKASLEAVAAETAPEVDAELRASAAVADSQIDLIVELAPRDGGEPIREARTASRASALAQARAMARAAIKTLVPGKPIASKEPAAEDVPSLSAAYAAAVTAGKAKPYPVERGRYDRRMALKLSWIPMSLLVGAGAFMVAVLPNVGEGDDLIFYYSVLGPVLAANGAVFGPAIGYYYLHRPGRALLMTGARLLLAGAGAWMTIAYVVDLAGEHYCGSDSMGEDLDCPDESRYPALLPIGIILVSASVVLAFVDAALVGRAADRANAEWREKKRLELQAAPIALPDGNGGAMLGLSVGGRF